jgi:hypothetical protein
MEQFLAVLSGNPWGQVKVEKQEKPLEDSTDSTNWSRLALDSARAKCAEFTMPANRLERIAME